ncbi:hypothetical protein [Desulfogranum marinum]|uniref:hypothetical protein n=1 Tax=Desulfogranum marinum TaxID=453220 RepID=UPI0019659C1B|nr:hypothetical protein [Desulfogranum marinum]MBM9512365.1 hypothetical protein [Desulfogranum marinum]
MLNIHELVADSPLFIRIKSAMAPFSLAWSYSMSFCVRLFEIHIDGQKADMKERRKGGNRS